MLAGFYKYDLIILGFSLISLFLLIKATDLAYPFDWKWLRVFNKFSYGNDIVINISTGYMVSAIFYLLNVFLPKMENLTKYNEIIKWNIDVIYKKLAKIFVMILDEQNIHVIENCSQEALITGIETVDPSNRYQYEGVENNINLEISECYGLVLRHGEYLINFHSIIPVELLKILIKIKDPILMLDMSIIKSTNKGNFKNFQKDLLELHAHFKELALFKEVFIDKKTL